MENKHKHQEAVTYIRAKVNQLLTLLGTLPLRPEELDDNTLIELDPIGIVADSFAQVLDNLNTTNRELQIAKDEIRTILDAMGAAVLVLNRDQTIDDCNRQAIEWFLCGKKPEDVRGQLLESACRYGTANEQRMLTENLFEIDFMLNDRHYHVVRSEISDAPDSPGKIVLLYFDITRQKQDEGQLRLYAQIFRSTAEGAVITDPDQCIIEVNDAFCRITGYAVDELRGSTPQFLRSGLHDDAFYDEMWRQVSQNGYWRGEITGRKKDGSAMPLLVTISAVRNADGVVSHYFTLMSDISHFKEAQSRLNYLAYHDALTGLPNRVLLQDRMKYAMGEADQRDRLVAVMFLDLDRFKTINDTLGHDTGDALLKAVAERLAICLRPGDTVSRLGGDEFSIVLANVAHVDDVTSVAQKIVGQFLSPFRIGGRDLFVGPSIGITLYPLDEKDTASLLKDADAAMYHAKKLGGNTFQFYTPELNVRVARRLELETGLRQALERQEFVLHYQPLVDVRTGQIRGMEALLRWQHPVFGLVPPLDFIPLAEETGLIIPIGEWVLKTACAQIKAWHETGFPAMQVAVNLSSNQVRDKNLIDVVKRALDVAGLEARYLDLELTESVLMQDMELAATILKELKAVGVSFSLDDFGTGYSSLSYLKHFPIDYLKIDRSFIRDITTDLFGEGIVRAIIVMAHTLNIKVVAEGVETHEQLTFLQKEGCDITQGYYCSPPLTAEAFTDLLHDWQHIRLGKCLITEKKVRKTRKR